VAKIVDLVYVTDYNLHPIYDYSSFDFVVI